MIPDINLLPKFEKRKSESKLFYLLLGIFAFLLLSYFIWQFFHVRADITTLESKETNLISGRNQLQTQIEASQSTNQGTIEQSLAFVEQISYPVSSIIDETKALQPPNSYLREYSFESDSVNITIDCETLTDIAQYISKLTNSPYFVDGQVVSVTHFELGPDHNEETNLDVQPRQTAEIALQIDKNYLAAGGVQ